VSTDPDKLLSEYIDAWNAGKRPDAGTFLARAGPGERGALSDDIASFLTWAPTPDYDETTLDAIAAEPIVVEAFAAAREQAGLLPSLLSRARARAALSTRELASVSCERSAYPRAASRRPSTTWGRWRTAGSTLPGSRVAC